MILLFLPKSYGCKDSPPEWWRPAILKQILDDCTVRVPVWQQDTRCLFLAAWAPGVRELLSKLYLKTHIWHVCFHWPKAGDKWSALKKTQILWLGERFSRAKIKSWTLSFQRCDSVNRDQEIAPLGCLCNCSNSHLASLEIVKMKLCLRLVAYPSHL